MPMTATNGLGVNIHFTDSTADMDMIQAAGCKFVRMDLAWDQVETKAGQYDFSNFDQLVRQASARGIRVLAILNFGNSLYGTDPGQETWRTGFSNFAAAAAAHYKGKGNVYELWNEPDGTFWPGGSNPSQYMALANKAIPAMRAADSTCKIIGPATCSATDVDFCKYVFQNGLLNLVDAVSVHGYAWNGDPAIPEKNVTDYTNVRYWMQTYGGKTLPLVVSEWGYTTSNGVHSTYNSANPTQLQGDFLARSMLVNLSQGIPLSIWYDWKNDGTDPTVDEQNFGTVTADLEAKPAYNELQLLTESLRGETFTSKLDDGHTSDWLLVFTAPDGQKTLAAWTTGSSRYVGNVTGWGAVNLTLTNTPQYLNPSTVPEPGAMTMLIGLLLGLFVYKSKTKSIAIAL